MEAVSLTIFAALIVLAWFAFRPTCGWCWILRKRFALSDRVLREDALKYFARCEVENEPASLRGLAGSLEVGGGATSRIISQLAEQKLLAIEGGEFRLTENGRRYGLRMIRAHRLYETYMSEKTGFRGEEWHERAERAEHKLTEEDMRALDRALAYPVRDPHGDPIPDAEGAVAPPEGLISADELRAGRRCTIVHLEDEPAEFFRRIAAAGLYPGQEIEILADGETEIRILADDGEHRLPRLVAANIHVVPREEQPSDEGGKTADGDDARRSPAENLAAIPAGEPRHIRGISPRIAGSERRRLMDLGFLPGTTIVKEFAGASGDPIAFQVRGSLMALRRAQAEQILVEPAPTGGADPLTKPAAGGTA
jgi:DtxR family Mn-dependent transcriptional regulator